MCGRAGVSVHRACLRGVLEDGVQVSEAVGVPLLSCLSSSAFPIDLVTLVISFDLGFALGKKDMLKKKWWWLWFQSRFLVLSGERSGFCFALLSGRNG